MLACDLNIGFEFQGQWITKPFVDASGRYEFNDIDEMYNYYCHNEDGCYEDGAKEKVYEFILRILQ